MTTDDQLREAYARAVDARAVPERSGCLSPEAIFALVRRDGSETARLAALDHAMACPACRDELELLRSIERAGGAGTRKAVEGLRWKRNLSMALAASAILAVSLETGRRFLGDDGVTLRGAADEITLLSPGDNQSASPAGDGPLIFAWRPIAGADRYVLEVMTAGGESVLSEQSADTTFTMRAAGALDPGEYRWWVRAQLGDGSERRSSARRLTVHAP